MNKNIIKKLFSRVCKYKTISLLALKNRKEYIINFIGSITYLPFLLIILYFVWYIIFKTLGIKQFGPYTLPYLFAYYFMAHFISFLGMNYTNMTFQIWSDINKGALSIYLCRPIDYLTYTFTKGIGNFLLNVLICIPIAIIVLVIICKIPFNIIHLTIFLISTFLSVTITYLIYSIIGTIAFWTGSVFGVRDLITSCTMIFSGALIPLDLLPFFLVKIGSLMPFRGIIAIPTIIYLFHSNLSKTLSLLIFQLTWIIILSIILRFLWNLGIKRYEAQGS